MAKLRNITILHRVTNPLNTQHSFAEQLFSDWYDVADWLKQENEKGNDVTVRNWRYSDKRL